MNAEQLLQKIIGELQGYTSPEVAALLPLVATLLSALQTRLLALQQQTEAPETDHLLTTEQVASRLRKSTKWVRENAQMLPFVMRMGRDYRFSARGLEQWIAGRLFG